MFLYHHPNSVCQNFKAKINVIENYWNSFFMLRFSHWSTSRFCESYIFFIQKKRSMRWEKSMCTLMINRDIFLSGLIYISTWYLFFLKTIDCSSRFPQWWWAGSDTLQCICNWESRLRDVQEVNSFKSWCPEGRFQHSQDLDNFSSVVIQHCTMYNFY